jgi:transposase
MQNAKFATDLSDAQWTYLEPMLPKPAQAGRPRTPLRLIVNAPLYIAKAGCHWHLLPKSFPPYKTVFHVFRHGWRRKLWVDGGFGGEDFADHVKSLRKVMAVEVVKRSDTAKGFKVLPRRWVVERTFGWFMQCRRLVRDYERTVQSATGWMHMAMIRIMLRKLA